MHKVWVIMLLVLSNVLVRLMCISLVKLVKFSFLLFLHRESKMCHPNLGYNFVNSWSICKILSLLQRALNFQPNRYLITHHTLSTLLHYFEKLKNQKFALSMHVKHVSSVTFYHLSNRYLPNVMHAKCKFLIYKFSKIMQQHTQGVVGNLIWFSWNWKFSALLQQWKNFANRSRTEKVIAMVSVVHFSDSRCIC